MTGTEASPTGCPQCGSDDYNVELDAKTGSPDYDHGEKTCNECGEVWV